MEVFKALSHMGTLIPAQLNRISSAAQLNPAHCSEVQEEGLGPSFGSSLFLLLVQNGCKQYHSNSER